MRQPVRRLIELPVTPRSPTTAERHRIRGAATCPANNRGTDTSTGAAGSTTPGYHLTQTRHSAASTTSTEDNTRLGSAVIATTTRCKRPINI
ncbi:hypothetical protein I552_0143 [Mycobacterium xenopi 3993]|nr:hypothetical protein I552_0143 [Mycobacterium xenopi 3993]